MSVIYGILALLSTFVCANLYSKWQDRRNFEADKQLATEQAKVEALKSAIKATEKELQDAGKDYNSVYNAYNKQYSKVPRETTSGV